MDKVNLKVGDILKITKNVNGHEFPIGIKVRLINAQFGYDSYVAEYLDGHDYWYLTTNEFTKVGEANV